jgi:type VI secretion system secreted protein VgrG
VQSYGASLRLASAARTWMPEPRHPRPVMAGLFSATVTGPAGEQIHVDEFGRIKVRFRWDTAGPKDDTSSCWVRVMQAAAGAWGGTWFLPRVGDEVLVAFLDGDPDRPLVAGSVYGKDAKPPFDPGKNRSQSGYSTRSYKSDAAADSNQLRFEDKKGKEEVLLHAQKDLKVEVENDETRNVDHDQTTTVKNARTTTIKDADDTLTLEKGNRKETLKMGNDSLTLEMGNESHAIKMGNLTVKCDLGQVTIEAMQSITLKVGQSSVVIDQMGVTVKGMLVTSEAQMVNKTQGLIVEQKGSAMVQVQGGIVMIN